MKVEDKVKVEVKDKVEVTGGAIKNALILSSVWMAPPVKRPKLNEMGMKSTE